MRIKFKKPELKYIRNRPVTSYNTSQSPNFPRFNRSVISPNRESNTPLSVNRTCPKPFSKPTLLQIIKNRSKKSLPKTSPVLAHTVLKFYFLPYFEEKLKNDNDKLRIVRYGNKSKSPSKKHFAKLSDILKQKLKTTQNELENLKSQLNSVNKDKEKIIKDTEKLRKELSQYRATENSLETNKKVFANWVIKKGQKSNFIHNKIVKYKEISNLMILEHLRILKVTGAELVSNEIFKSHAKQSKFWHIFLEMINKITGETLKGIFYSLTEVIKEENLEKIAKNIQDSIIKISDATAKTEILRIMSLFRITSNRSVYINKSNEHINSRINIFKELKSLKVAIIDHIERLTENLKKTSEETLNLSSELGQKEKEIIDFSLEYESMQTKLKEAQAQMRIDKRELLCKFCNKNFYEAENFNWSCTTHTSEWSGNMYWCCGATFKESVGCNKKKHFAREDDEENEKNEFENLLAEKEIPQFCTSCKKSGHLAHDCLIDPNLYDKSTFTKKNKVKIGEISPLFKSKHKFINKKSRKLEKKVKKSTRFFEDIDEIKAIASQSVSPTSSINSSMNSSRKSFANFSTQSNQTGFRSITPSFSFTNK